MMLKLVDTSQKYIILGIFILNKDKFLRALLEPPPPQDGVSEFTGQYPLMRGKGLWNGKVNLDECFFVT